jgi:hypothetical protein
MPWIKNPVLPKTGWWCRLTDDADLLHRHGIDRTHVLREARVSGTDRGRLFVVDVVGTASRWSVTIDDIHNQEFFDDTDDTAGRNGRSFVPRA